jgi:hypothetical protein
MIGARVKALARYREFYWNNLFFITEPPTFYRRVAVQFKRFVAKSPEGYPQTALDKII